MSKKRIVVIIPARMAASRFPGKPLAKIMELPMIEHVRRRACLSKTIDEVYVATCDEEIYKIVKQLGGKAIMTSDSHQRCTDRVEEAAQKIETTVVVIIQGDEPLFDPAILDGLVSPFIKNEEIQCVNLLSRIAEENDLVDIDIVKAVINNNNQVMYYSRAPIPYFRIKNECPMYRQTGISAFTKTFLHKFSHLAPTLKEKAESIDFIRILDHGFSILGVIYPKETVGVDREDDIPKIEAILRKDQFQQSIYRKILDFKTR
ncbi:MAG: 3-deoxy-manno-octulosonate cytidylyltransferase [Candidatus Omnitrophica bacterium]|nr:3-deoxy-manno-octulosonate cytidylyltransferase [Candidatus Omnitrophota bacterium]